LRQIVKIIVLPFFVWKLIKFQELTYNDLKQSEQFFRNIPSGMYRSVECENISHNPHPVRDASLQDAV
jgi:hypothetical protein